MLKGHCDIQKGGKTTHTVPESRQGRLKTTSWRENLLVVFLVLKKPPTHFQYMFSILIKQEKRISSRPGFIC